MSKLEKEIEKLSDVWKKFNIEGYMNLSNIIIKEFSYNPLGNEISNHENIELQATINIFKNNKKLCLKSENLKASNIEKLIKDNLFLIDSQDEDEDNKLYEIKDFCNSDERKFNIKNISLDFFEKQWNIVKNFKLQENISIEGFSYSVGEKEKYFINSNGSIKSEKSNYTNYYYSLLYSSKNFSQVDYEIRNTCDIEDISEDFLKNVEKKLILRSNPKKPSLKSGKHNIALKNNVAGDFLDLFLEGLKGENIRQNLSFFTKNDIGKKIGESSLNIISNPKIKNSCFNRLFDSEGISSEKLEIIKNGELKNIFLDSKNARKFSMNPSGNPSYSNIEITGNKKDDYLKDSSFLITDFLGMNTTDFTTGKFAIEVEGFEIKNGEIGNYVKNVGYNGNIKNLFLDFYVMGDDIFENSSIFCPSLCFKNQTLIF